jgi:hypothetical protein
MSKRRIHDGIVGALVIFGVILGVFANSLWLLIPAIIGIALFQSAFTGFCPVYFTLDKVMQTP